MMATSVADDDSEWIQPPTKHDPHLTEQDSRNEDATRTFVVKKTKKAKFKKAPQAPRRFRSSFIFFSAAKHKEIREQLNELGVSRKTSSIAKIVAEEWKNLTHSEREKWVVMSRNDKVRFEVEKSSYNGPWRVPTYKRAPEDPTAPKRPLPAFMAFCNERQSMVRREHQEQNDDAQTSKMLLQMWNEASEDTRRKYIVEELEQKEQYKVAVSDWRAKNEAAQRVERKLREEKAMWLAESSGKIALDNDDDDEEEIAANLKTMTKTETSSVEANQTVSHELHGRVSSTTKDNISPEGPITSFFASCNEQRDVMTVENPERSNEKALTMFSKVGNHERDEAAHCNVDDESAAMADCTAKEDDEKVLKVQLQQKLSMLMAKSVPPSLSRERQKWDTFARKNKAQYQFIQPLSEGPWRDRFASQQHQHSLEDCTTSEHPRRSMMMTEDHPITSNASVLKVVPRMQTKNFKGYTKMEAFERGEFNVTMDERTRKNNEEVAKQRLEEQIAQKDDRFSAPGEEGDLDYLQDDDVAEFFKSFYPTYASEAVHQPVSPSSARLSLNEGAAGVNPLLSSALGCPQRAIAASTIGQPRSHLTGLYHSAISYPDHSAISHPANRQLPHQLSSGSFFGPMTSFVGTSPVPLASVCISTPYGGPASIPNQFPAFGASPSTRFLVNRLRGQRHHQFGGQVVPYPFNFRGNF